MFWLIFQFTITALILVLFVSQVAYPLVVGLPLFWAFSKNALKEREALVSLNDTKTKKHINEIMQETETYKEIK